MPLIKDKISSFPDTQDVDNTMIPTYNKSTGKNERISVSTLRGNLAQAQSDWNQTDSAQADFIKNKPTIPEPYQPNIYEVTAMFDFPSAADFSAWLYKSRVGGRDKIEIRADDTTGVTEDLIVTAEMGFGSDTEKPVPFKTLTKAAGWSIDNRVYDESEGDIYITTEAPGGLSPTQIHIPKECNRVGTFYFVGTNNRKVSYWVDTPYRKFTAAATPLGNFVNVDGQSQNITIEGETVGIRDIRELQFGQDYDGETALPGYALFNLPALRALTLPKNITAFGSANLYSLPSLEALTLPAGLQSMGNYCMLWLGTLASLTLPDGLVSVGSSVINVCSQLKYLCIPSSLTNVGANFCMSVPALTEIQINGFDASLATINATNGFLGAPNTADCILRANSRYLAEVFKAKFPALSNWTIVVNQGYPEQSFYITTDGEVVLFTASGTPLSGFVTSTSTFDPCIIEGVSVPRATIQKIVFGQDYNAITTIPAGFLNNMLAANFEMNLAGLKNVTTLDGFNGCSVKYLDISMFTNVTSIGWGVFGRYDQLLEIQIGSMDWSKINTTNQVPFYTYTARPAGIIHADTQALGEAFQTACAPSLDGWTVVIN